jgi:glycosyltransferase involved in cell wall biosynthesis
LQEKRGISRAAPLKKIKMKEIFQKVNRKKTGDQKKHIAFYIGSLHKGGAERVFVNLSDYFRKNGYKVTMVTQYLKKDEYELPDGVTRVISDIGEEELNNSRIVNFCRRVRKLHRIWKKEQPDMVLSCIGKNNFMAVVTAMFTKTKPVVSVVGEAGEEYPTRLMRGLANLLFPHAAGIILQTERSKYFFNKKIQRKAVILPNSLNPAFVKPRYEGEREKRIVAVGRMDANKNHEMMVRAFAALADKYPDYTLTIYGDGELRSYIEETARSLGVGEKVFLPGVIPDVAKQIERASLFLITSYSEGVSNALIEALATGLAVIATDVPSGGTVELMEDGVNGLIIPAGDTEALTKAMDRLLSDPVYREQLGREAAKIQERLKPERVNELWREYFEKVMAE